MYFQHKYCNIWLSFNNQNIIKISYKNGFCFVCVCGGEGWRFNDNYFLKAIGFHYTFHYTFHYIFHYTFHYTSNIYSIIYWFPQARMLIILHQSWSVLHRSTLTSLYHLLHETWKVCAFNQIRNNNKRILNDLTKVI